METFTWLGKIDACNHTDSNLIRGCPFKGALCGAALLTLLSFSPLAASAGLIFLDLPGIDGGQSLPGFPGAIAVQSLEVMPGQLTIVKPVDSASPALFNAVATGTVFPSAFSLLYNSAPTGLPAATLALQNVLATSVTSNGGTEQVGFVA